MHVIGTFEPRDAKRVMTLLDESHIPFELQEDNSALATPNRGIALSLGMYPDGSRIIIMVPEPEADRASELLMKLYPV